MLHYINSFPAGPVVWSGDTLGDLPCIRPGCSVEDSSLGSWTELMPGSDVRQSVIGEYSYTAGDVQVIYADVGRFCSIASHVRINPGNHPMQRPAQHHFTYRRRQYGFAAEDDAAFFAWRAEHRCRIGHDVWIGHAAIVMPGVSVGNGAVIAAGTIVTRDVPPYAIVAGVPARPVRMRFEPRIVEKLQAIAWWDWDRPTLEKHFNDLCGDVKMFIARFGN